MYEAFFVSLAAVEFCNVFFISPVSIAVGQNIFGSAHELRNLLLHSGMFGDPNVDSKRVLLHRAYINFKQFCSAKGIYCSQPAFQEKLATWQTCESAFKLASMPSQCAQSYQSLYAIDATGPHQVVSKERGCAVDREGLQWTMHYAMAYGSRCCFA